MHSAEKSISLNSGICKCFTMLKNEFNILAYSSSLVIILSLSTNTIFSEDFTLSYKRVFTLFQNCLYLSHLCSFKFTLLSFLVFLKRLTQRNYVTACCNRL